MGQEGNFGLVTEAVIKIKQIPSKKVWGSVLFPDFELGIKFMEEVGKSGIWAASMRLMDNTQFMFGMALKPREYSKAKLVIDAIKKYYVINVKGFDQNKSPPSAPTSASLLRGHTPCQGNGGLRGDRG